MAKQRDSYPIPEHLYGTLHPAVATLEKVMNDYVVALDIFDDLNKKAKEAYREIEPTDWTARIEAATKKPAELARLSAQYGEQALTFLSQRLQWSQAEQNLIDNRRKLNDAIVIVIGDVIDPTPTWHYPVAAIQAKVVEARALYNRTVGGDKPQARKSEGLRAADCWKAPESPLLHYPSEIHFNLQKIQAAAFATLTAELSKNVENGLYTSQPVVANDMLTGGEGRAAFSRSLQFVKFSDRYHRKFPASANLLEQGMLLEAIRPELYRVLPSEQNGRINESQHASRLIGILGPDAGALKGYSRVDNLEEQIDAQNERRLSFESYRLSIHLRLHLLQESIRAVAKSLQDAVLETSSAFQAEVASRSLRDMPDDLCIMINNCLKADLLLRTSGQELRRTKAEFETDRSQGAGKQALSAAFADARTHYDNQVQRRRQQLERDKAVSAPKK
jgi:hypothetical protein